MAEIYRQAKRKLEEESTVKEVDGVDSHKNFRSFTDLQKEDYDSDDGIVTFAGGRKMSREHREEYLRQMNESEGFDITLDLELGAALGGPIVPLRGEENDPEIIELSHLAIDKFNSQNGKNYILVKHVTVNASVASGYWYYITFEARDADDDVKTFQALAWWGMDGSREVKFCRLKKSSSDEGDERSPDSDVGVKATQ